MQECPFSNEELPVRLAARDPAAWDWLYDRYAPMVYSVAVRKLRESEARDVVQTVFIEMMRVVGQGAEVQHVGGFLHKIAVRRTLDALKKRLGEEARAKPLDHGASDDESSSPASQIADDRVEAPSAAGEAEEQGVMVRRLTSECLVSLPAAERMAAELLIARVRGDNGLSWAEIRDQVRGRHSKTVNLARVFDKFRNAFSRLWEKATGMPAARLPDLPGLAESG